MRKLTLWTVALVLCTPALADIILLPGSSSCPGCANILFKQLPVSGTTINAATQGGTLITIGTFEGTTLLAPSGGQARVEDNAGVGLRSLIIDLAAGGGASYFEFTVQQLNGPSAPTPPINMTVTLISKSPWVSGTHSDTFVLAGNGQNRNTWQATDNWAINRVELRFDKLIQAVQQIRLTDAVAPPDPVPEPATLFSIGGGLALLAVIRKRMCGRA